MAVTWQWVEHGFAAFGAFSYLFLAHRGARMAIEDEFDGPVHALEPPFKQVWAYFLGLFWPLWGVIVLLEMAREKLP